MLLNTILLMSGGATQALQLIASLSLLILLHEFGHFFFARLFKVRVEKFYLFFDFLFPFSGLLNFSIFKKKVGDTEYGLGWFPLGGYVKIAGMVDESMDKEQMALPPQPWEYRSKKAWQRLFIMLGGIIMNVIVAMVIYTIMFAGWGEEYLPTQNAQYGIMADSTAQSIGLQNGDKIVSVDGKQVPRFNKIVGEIIFNEAKAVQVDRNGQAVNINIPEGTIRNIIKRRGTSFIQPRIPSVVDEVVKGSAAEKLGIKANDSLIAMNGQPVVFLDEVNAIKKANVGKPVSITVMRNHKDVLQFEGLVLQQDKLTNFQFKSYDAFFKLDKIKYSVPEAIVKGFTFTFDQFGSYWRQFKMIFTSKEIKASESVGGIVSFGKLFSPVFDWHDFLALTAFVSIILAFMNLLPIPGLDGGYVIFLIYEMISRRKVSEKVMERATTVGLVLLLGLMLYANGLDIFRLFKK